MYTISTPEQLALYLKAFRKARNLNQTELGLRLGLTKARVSAIENAPGRVGLSLLLRVLDALELQLSVDDARRLRAAATGAVRAGEW